jgi:transcriptional regulator with XRE-family HTH domain
MTLLERIDQLRLEHGKMSVNKLEREAGLTRGSMSKWDDHQPSYDKLKKVADYFGVSVEYLLSGDEREDTQQGAKKDPAQMGEVDMLDATAWSKAFDRMSKEQQRNVLDLLMKRYLDN